MSDFEPFGFATRKSEINFWETVADTIVFSEWPGYHIIPRYTPGLCCVCALAINLHAWVEDKLIQLKEKPP